MAKKQINPQQQCLFDADEMGGITKGDLWEKKDEPVFCLGMTFESEEARREYFRNELRQKMPELRKIEGFPIGTDDDIINLSDPPYYTACPNPWLNDFIAQWEEEKKQLVAEGKRDENKVVTEPYAYGIKQGKNSTIYNAHTYHTKVPHEVIMRYILHYTQPGDFVLDGFAGTGMTGVAASLCGLNTTNIIEINNEFKNHGYSLPQWGHRHSICGDISPLCYHIASNYNSSVNVRELKTCVGEILRRLHERFDYFYHIPVEYNGQTINAHINYFVWSEVVSCKNCGHELNVHDLSFDYETKTLHKELVCPYCGTVQKRINTTQVIETYYDDQLRKSISLQNYVCCLMNYNIPKHGRHFSNEVIEPEYPQFVGNIPTNLFSSGDKYGDPKRVGVTSINMLYYKRTKYVLAYLHDLIYTDYCKYKKALMFIFTSMLPKLTRMNRYMPQHGSRALVGPMANTLYIPPMSVENNPIDQFEYQADKVLRAFELCSKGSAIQICSATNSLLLSESIDYIFTDPPFGSNIMYSELNYVSESWLNVFTNNREEAIANKTQCKGLIEYQTIMEACFKEYYRVLKHGKWMTVEFSNTSQSFWNCLQNSIRKAGFVISSVTDLNKERGGLHSMLGPTAVKQDLAISCYKPSQKVIDGIKGMKDSSLWSFVDEYINKTAVFIKENGKTHFIIERDPRILFDRVISYYIQNGINIPIDAKDFQKGLRERYIEKDGMFFTALQAAEYEEKKKAAPEFVPMGIIVSDEANGIEWLKNQLRDAPKTYQEIQPEWMQAINGVRKGDILPELKTILEENFIEMDDGKWRLPNIQDDVDKTLMRTKALLKEFNIYKEQANKAKGKIKEARVEALRAGFKQCYIDKDFQTIVTVGDKIPQNLRDEDEVLLQFYDIALNKI